MSPDPPSPWAEFLGELDGLLNEPFELHCVGGFAAVVAYGLPRSTNDLDYFSLVPSNRIGDLESLAGAGSALARKYKVHVHHAGVTSMPESYADRLMEIFPGHFKNIRLFVPDPYDLILSKLSRNVARDREDVEYLARTLHLDARVLRDRYATELRPILIGSVSLHDQTLELWVEAYFPAA